MNLLSSFKMDLSLLLMMFFRVRNLAIIIFGIYKTPYIYIYIDPIGSMGLVSSPAVEWFSGFHVGKYAIWSHGSFEEWEIQIPNLKWCIFSDLQKRAGRVFQPSWVGTKPMHREHPTIPVIQHPLQFDVNRYPQNDGLFGGTTVSIDCFSGVSFMASNVAKISGGIRIPCWNFERPPGVMREVLSYTWDVGHCNGSLENVEAQLEMFFFRKKTSNRGDWDLLKVTFSGLYPW